MAAADRRTLDRFARYTALDACTPDNAGAWLIMEIPIICTLSEAALKERRAEILDRVKGATIKTTELPNGYAYEFPFDAEMLTVLARLIALEHECCRFLTFRISLEAGKEAVALEITSSQAAKPVIANFLGGG